MTTKAQALYIAYTQIMQKAADFNNAAAVLGWDQEVYMPAGGAAPRARQLATLAGAAHELLTSDKLGNLLHELSSGGDFNEVQQANIKCSLDDFTRNKKISSDFVTRLSYQASACYHAWVDARSKNDFSIYATLLSQMVAIKREEADLFGYEGHPYNALLDEYDKGSTVALLDGLFERVKSELFPLLQFIKERPTVNTDFFREHFPQNKQWDFSIDVLRAMGYDFERGRQDYAPHPFTTSFGASDVRITTRADEHNFAYMLWSTIHEGGHALYEQGLLDSQYGLPCGSAASLSIHESQSRLWENCIGRSQGFWKAFYPALQEKFQKQLAAVDEKQFWKATNHVGPSLIRTEADELTYHFHIMVRYEIEKGIISGAIQVADLPEIWNGLYQQYLGITPDSFSNGVLQDVHWSHGSFGYFPTYSTGSFYAAQFYQSAAQAIDGLNSFIQQGNFAPLLDWLRTNIHCAGRMYTSEELCQKVTGSPLNLSCFVNYAREKYSTVYE